MLALPQSPSPCPFRHTVIFKKIFKFLQLTFGRSDLCNPHPLVRNGQPLFPESCRHFRPYSKSKLEQNSKKVNLSDAKIFLSVFLFLALKAKLQDSSFEFCQIKLRYNQT